MVRQFKQKIYFYIKKFMKHYLEIAILTLKGHIGINIEILFHMQHTRHFVLFDKINLLKGNILLKNIRCMTC